MRALCLLCSLPCLVLRVSTARLGGIIHPDKIVMQVGSQMSARCLLSAAPSASDVEPCTSSYIHWSLNGSRLPAAAYRPLNATVSELRVDTTAGTAGPAGRGVILLLPGRAMLTCAADCPFRGLETLYGVEVSADYPPGTPQGLSCESEGVNGNMTCSWEPGKKMFLPTTHLLQYRQHSQEPDVSWSNCVAPQGAASAAATSTSCKFARGQVHAAFLYDFRVVATNAVGRAESAVITTSQRHTVKTEVPVFEEPTFVEEQPDQVTLHWRPPSDSNYPDFFPLKYELSVTSHVDGTIKKDSSIPTNSVSFSLFYMRPYSKYSARIRCTFDTNPRGSRGGDPPPAAPSSPLPVWSEWSKPLTFTTPEAAPAVAPELWRISREPDKMGNQVTTLVWKALDESQARGEILEYRLVCTHATKTQFGGCTGAGNFSQEKYEHGGGGDYGGRECSGSLWRLDAKSRSLTVRTKPSAGAEGAARVHLWACNGAGASPVALIRVAAAAPATRAERGALRDSQPTLDVKSGGETRLAVTWQVLPKAAKRLSGWVLQLCHPCREACTSLRWWRLPAHVREAPIDSVVRGQCYAVSLSRIMEDGLVGSSVSQRVYSAEEAPSASPSELMVKEGKTSALVSWHPLKPADQRGFIIEYIVHFHSPGDNLSVVQVNGSQTKAWLGNLRPNSKYRVSVFARNSAGQGPRSNDYMFTTLVYDVGELEAIVVTASLLGLFFLMVILLLWGKMQGRVKKMIWPRIASPGNSKAIKSLINDMQTSSAPASPVSQSSWDCDMEPNVIQTEEEFCTNIEELGKKCPPEQTSVPTPRSSSSGGDDEPYSSISLIDPGSKVTPPAPATPILSLPPPPAQSVRRYINTVAPSYENLMGGDRQWQAAREQTGPGGNQQRENEFGGNSDVGAGYGRNSVFGGGAGGGGGVGNGGVGVSSSVSDGGDAFGGGGGGGRRDTRHVELFVDLEKVSLLQSDASESPTEASVVMSYLPQSVKDPGYMPQ